MKSEQEKIVHLLYRAGFGPSFKDLKDYMQLSYEQSVELLVSRSVAPYQPIQWKGVKKESEELAKSGGRTKAIKQRLKKGKRELNFRWLMKISKGDAQLREKMAFFWHDHFPVNIPSPKFSASYLNILRANSLGYFKDLLFGVSKDASMLTYLNNRENKKEHPNENFAREVMELFTLGLGNYTEQDILEAARAFTGWTCKKNGDFVFRRKNHDRGIKTFLGTKGAFTGKEILDMLCEHPATSKYLTGKIFYFLVGQEISPSALEKYSKIFAESDLHIGTLVKEILLGPEFIREEFIGVKIKSPIELLAGMIRVLDLDFNLASFLFKIQIRLRQTLLNPPNVSGWTSGKNWIDLSNIHERIELVNVLLTKDNYDFKAPVFSLEGDEFNFKKPIGKIKVDYDLSNFQNNLTSILGFKGICKMLYTCETQQLNVLFESLYKSYLQGDIETKDVIIKLMSQPEYQMC